jgi:hypothetical protein
MEQMTTVSEVFTLYLVETRDALRSIRRIVIPTEVEGPAGFRLITVSGLITTSVVAKPLRFG